MNKNKSIPLSCLAILFISTNALAEKTGAPKAPVIPSSTQLKAITPPASKAVQSIPAGAPTRKIVLPKTKQAAPAPKIPVNSIKRDTVKLPTGKKPAVSFKVPNAATSKSPATKTTIKIPSSTNITSRVKPGAIPGNAIGQKAIPNANTYQNLGKSKRSLGSASITPGRQSGLGVGLPGHNGFASNNKARTGVSSIDNQTLGNTSSGVRSVTDDLGQPVARVGRGSTTQSQTAGSGNTFGKLKNTRAEIINRHTYQDNSGNTVIINANHGEVVVGDVNDLTDEELADFTGTVLNKPEECTGDNCRDKNGKKKAGTGTGESTSVAGDEPDGEGATSGDVTLTGNGADTTGGVNQGGEQQASGEGGGAIRQIAGPGSQISDFDGNQVIINADDLGRLKVDPDVTGGIREGIDN